MLSLHHINQAVHAVQQWCVWVYSEACLPDQQQWQQHCLMLCLLPCLVTLHVDGLYWHVAAKMADVAAI